MNHRSIDPVACRYHKEGIRIMEEQLYTTDKNELERLISSGFSELEAMRILHMKDHVSEEIEYREMIEESRRLNFVRWLIDHDRLSK